MSPTFLHPAVRDRPTRATGQLHNNTSYFPSGFSSHFTAFQFFFFWWGVRIYMQLSPHQVNRCIYTCLRVLICFWSCVLTTVTFLFLECLMLTSLPVSVTSVRRFLNSWGWKHLMIYHCPGSCHVLTHSAGSDSSTLSASNRRWERQVIMSSSSSASVSGVDLTSIWRWSVFAVACRSSSCWKGWISTFAGRQQSENSDEMFTSLGLLIFVHSNKDTQESKNHELYELWAHIHMCKNTEGAPYESDPDEFTASGNTTVSLLTGSHATFTWIQAIDAQHILITSRLKRVDCQWLPKWHIRLD